MEHFIRITQTDATGIPEVHEDNTDVKDKSNLSQEVFDIKNSLISQMTAVNYKLQRVVSDHDLPMSERRGCTLEDI